MPNLQQHFDPYVRARCGEDNHVHYQRTLPVKGGSANPVWTKKHENELRLQRHPQDEKMLVVEVWDWDRWLFHRRFTGPNGKFVGGASMPRNIYLRQCTFCSQRAHEA